MVCMGFFFFFFPSSGSRRQIHISGTAVGDAAMCFNVLCTPAAAKRFAGVRMFLGRLIKAHFHPAPLGERKHLAVTSD